MVHASHLSVVGCTAGSPSECGPASGYLVRTRSTTVLVDCGPGIVAALARSGVIDDLDAVIVTHEHLDHCGDLVTLAYHRAFPTKRPPLALYAPESVRATLTGIERVFGIDTLPTLRRPLTDQLPLRPVEPGASIEIGDLAVETLRTRHPVPTIALRFPDLGVVYTADAALADDLVGFADGTGTLLAEATYVTEDGQDFEAHGHMSGRHAGELAARAGVGRLVLTHLSDFAQASATVAEAERGFGGTIEVAEPGLLLQRT